MYKLQLNKDMFTGEIKPAIAVIYQLDGAVIPFDPQNVDYQAYLKWVSEGNQPLPADEVTA